MAETDVKTPRTPFKFFTSSILVVLTGIRATHLKDFVEQLKALDVNVVFHHMHNAYREYHFAPGKYTNDFAYWIAEALGESALAEKIANIEVYDFTDLNSLKEVIIKAVEEYLGGAVEIRKAPPGKEFYFCRNVSFVVRTRYQANNLEELCEGLKRVGMRSLFFHFFEARLRLGRRTNDFSEWMRKELKEEALAQKIEKLNPYLYTLDELRDKIIDLIQEQRSPWIMERIKNWLRLN